MSDNITQSLRAYKQISKIAQNPIIYGSLAYVMYTRQNCKINDLDVLVRKSDLSVLAKRLKHAKYHKKYDTVHLKIAGIKVELDAKERWGPRNITTRRILFKRHKLNIVSRKTLIWFYKQGTKRSHKQKLKTLLSPE